MARARLVCGRRRPAATKSPLLARSFNEMASQLEQRTQALERSDRTRRQLLADVSHELSTPLAAIRGYVETLSMAEVPLTENTRRRYLHIVTDETERLEHIVGDLLELARLEGGGGSWREEDVSIAAAARAGQASARAEAPRKECDAADTEREASAETVVGDPEPPRTGAPEPGRQRDSSHAATRERSRSVRRHETIASSSPSKTPAPGSPRNTCRGSSIASTRSTSRARARTPRPAAVLACRSFARS